MGVVASFKSAVANFVGADKEVADGTANTLNHVNGNLANPGFGRASLGMNYLGAFLGFMVVLFALFTWIFWKKHIKIEEEKENQIIR